MQADKPKSTGDKKWYQSPWFKRIGLLGFLFFLIKGLVWLAIIFGVFQWFGDPVFKTKPYNQLPELHRNL